MKIFKKKTIVFFFPYHIFLPITQLTLSIDSIISTLRIKINRYLH